MPKLICKSNFKMAMDFTNYILIYKLNDGLNKNYF